MKINGEKITELLHAQKLVNRFKLVWPFYVRSKFFVYDLVILFVITSFIYLACR